MESTTQALARAMDVLNVLMIRGTYTFGLLVPKGCCYDRFVEMVAAEIRMDNSVSSLKIGYVVDVEMAPIMITSNSSLRFYLDLKRKDPKIASYPLHVEDGGLLTCNAAGQLVESGAPEQNQDSVKFPAHCDLFASCDISPSAEVFASTIEIDFKDPDEYERNDEISVVINQPAVEAIIEHQVFRDKKTLKTSVALYAIRNNFQFKVYKSDTREYVLKCDGELCIWKLRASKIGETDMFKIRYIRESHSCSMGVVLRDHRQAKSSLIGEFIKHKFTSAGTIYTPVDIMHDMATTHGLTVGYGKAWRAREHALEEVMGDPDIAYKKLKVFLTKLQHMNPGTKIGFEVDGNAHFRYAFMALGASIQGWGHCKPVVVVDATFLTGRYGGCLFTACTQDANNHIFILSFGIGDSENNDSWSWFLRRFKEAYGERENMCFVSDRHQSIEYSVQSVYPGVMHGFCAHHILQNLKTSYGNSGKNIAKPFNAAARAYTKHGFDYHMKQLDQISVGLRKDLIKIGFDKWSRAHSPTNRYSAITSNIVESVNSVVKRVKHCPVDYLFESLRFIVQSWFYKNRGDARGTFTRLATKQENLLRKNAKNSTKLKVSPSTDFLYQVSDENTKHLVDLEEYTCTCNRFQIDGVPCRHALAVIGSKEEQPYKYCSAFNTKECYVDIYAGNIIPLGDCGRWKNLNNGIHEEIYPPMSKRQPGRPKNTRIRTRAESIRPSRCGRCGGKGHNRRRCKQAPPLVHVRKRKRGSEVNGIEE